MGVVYWKDYLQLSYGMDDHPSITLTHYSKQERDHKPAPF